MLAVERSEPSQPAFSLRFSRGRGHLVLTSPLAIRMEARGGRAAKVASLTSLDLDLGPIRGGLRLQGGWRSVRTFRTELVSLSIEVDLEALSSLGPEQTLRVEGPSADGIGLRLLAQRGLHALAFEAYPRWRDGDLLLAVGGLRATHREGPTLLADLARALGPAGARFDPVAGVFLVPRPIRALLAEALLPLGMRIPSVRGLARSTPRIVVDGRGRSLLAVDVGASPSIREQLEAQGGERRDEEGIERVHVDARRVARVTARLVEGDVDTARREREWIRASLEPPLAEAVELAEAIELAGTTERDGAMEPGPPKEREPSLLRALVVMRDTFDRSMRAELPREPLERAIEAWLALEPSDTFAALQLLGLAEAARTIDAATSRSLARHAARYVARLPPARADAPTRDEERAAGRAIELAAGELPRALVEELLPRLGVERWLGTGLELADAQLPTLVSSRALDELLPEEVHAATAFALEAVGRGDLAERVWTRLRERDDVEVAMLVAAHDERHGERLRALDGYVRAAELAEAASAREEARRAWIRAATIAHSLSITDAVQAHLSRALAVESSMRVEDAVTVAGLVRSADLLSLSARVESIVVTATLADGGERPEWVGALEELLAWAIERGAATRARLLHDALVQVRPERAGLDVLPKPEALPEDPRARAERLRAEGALEEAARVLAELGERERDAATSRAALDLAERAGALELARSILDELLARVGSGPAREALERRRARLVR